jgi:hypothetical protein
LSSFEIGRRGRILISQPLHARELLASEIAVGIRALRLRAQHCIIDPDQLRASADKLTLVKQQRRNPPLLVRAKLDCLNGFDSPGGADGIDDWPNAGGIHIDGHRRHRHWPAACGCAGAGAFCVCAALTARRADSDNRDGEDNDRSDRDTPR